MIIFENSIFEDTLQAVDNIIGDFVHIIYVNLISSHQAALTSIFTLYVAFLGYKFIINDEQFSLYELTKKSIVMLVIYGFIMNWSLYNTFFYQLFAQEPIYINGVLSQTVNLSDAQSPAIVFDSIYNKAMNVSQILFGMSGFGKIQYLMYGLMFWLATFLSCTYALGILIYAKLAISIGLAIGPIFLIFLLWPSTKGLFEGWIKTLVHFSLVPLITSCILMVMLSIENMAISAITPDAPEALTLQSLGPYLCISIATLFMLMQIIPISKSLSLWISAVSKSLSS